MFSAFAAWLFELKGWRLVWNIPEGVRKAVVPAAPHTSNWDFFYTMAIFKLKGQRARFTIKQEWMRFPFNLLIEPLGGIGIDRRPKKPGDPRPSMVDVMAELFDQYDDLIVVVTPEGTRSPNDKWKTGYYYTALKAKVPICIGFMDYQLKTAGIQMSIEPTGDLVKDMMPAMAFWCSVTPKHPEMFKPDSEIYTYWQKHITSS